jgi:phosphate ABC transporter permease protein PstC
LAENRESGSHQRERYIKYLMFTCASISVLGIVLIILFIFKESWAAIRDQGWSLFTTTWNPANNQYGFLAFLNGTILTTLGGLLLGAPLAIGIAVFLDQIAPRRVADVIRRAVEMLAGIPSVIIGWFGMILLVPLLAGATGTGGYGIAAASLVLAVMVLPTIAALSAETLRNLPQELMEASLAMGATRWQTIRKVLLPASRKGILVAVILGMGRAIGETMAVQMVIGNSRQLTFSLFANTSTIPSRIVTEMGEATGVHRSALFFMALVLLLLSMFLVSMVRLVARDKGGRQ